MVQENRESTKVNPHPQIQFETQVKRGENLAIVFKFIHWFSFYSLRLSYNPTKAWSNITDYIYPPKIAYMYLKKIYTYLCAVNTRYYELKEVCVANGNVRELGVDVRDEKCEDSYIVFLTKLLATEFKI